MVLRRARVPGGGSSGRDRPKSWLDGKSVQCDAKGAVVKGATGPKMGEKEKRER